MKQKVEITFLAALALFQPLSLLENIPADVLHTDSLWDKRHPTACFHTDPSSPPPSPAHVCAHVPGVLQVLGMPWEQPGDSSELAVCRAVLPGLCVPAQALEEEICPKISASLPAAGQARTGASFLMKKQSQE